MFIPRLEILRTTISQRTKARLGFADKPELAGDTIVFLTQERRERLAGRYLSCTWDMEELLARDDEITKGDKLKVRLVL